MGLRKLGIGIAMGAATALGVSACVLPRTEEMYKFAKEAPMCRTVEAWDAYTGALGQESAGVPALASLTSAGECVAVKAGTVVTEISLDEDIPSDAIAVRFANWEQEDAKGPVAGVTWRENIASWKFRESGAWVKPWK